jgi:hypothetical protein
MVILLAEINAPPVTDSCVTSGTIWPEKGHFPLKSRTVSGLSSVLGETPNGIIRSLEDARDHHALQAWMADNASVIPSLHTRISGGGGV